MVDTPGDAATLVHEPHVDISRAENEFNALAQRLRNSADTVDIQDDIEKGEKAEVFDLREYLQSSNDANQAAGIKHKHVGVSWEGLQVISLSPTQA